MASLLVHYDRVTDVIDIVAPSKQATVNQVERYNPIISAYKVTDVIGWGRFTMLWQVEFDDNSVCYFLTDEPIVRSNVLGERYVYNYGY